MGWWVLKKKPYFSNFEFSMEWFKRYIFLSPDALPSLLCHVGNFIRLKMHFRSLCVARIFRRRFTLNGLQHGLWGPGLIIFTRTYLYYIFSILYSRRSEKCNSFTNDEWFFFSSQSVNDSFIKDIVAIKNRQENVFVAFKMLSVHWRRWLFLLVVSSITENIPE